MTLTDRKKRIQRELGFTGDSVDGIFGLRSVSALERAFGIVEAPPAAPIFPRDTVADITEVFGPPGTPDKEPDLSWFKMPYPMHLYERTGKILTKHRCHRKVVKSLEGVLETARDELGMDFIRAHDLDLYFGCYDARAMRGRSRSISRHSWGIAIDIAAASNGFKTPWPDVATMPESFIRIFESAGWKSGARAWGKDAMHFQATQ